MFVSDAICDVHSRLSTIITVNSIGVSGACACCRSTLWEVKWCDGACMYARACTCIFTLNT